MSDYELFRKDVIFVWRYLWQLLVRMLKVSALLIFLVAVGAAIAGYVEHVQDQAEAKRVSLSEAQIDTLVEANRPKKTSDRAELERLRAKGAQPRHFNLKLPNGTVIKNVPYGTSKADVLKKLQNLDYDAYGNKEDMIKKLRDLGYDVS